MTLPTSTQAGFGSGSDDDQVTTSLNVDARIDIEKSADVGAIAATGSDVTYTYTVTNKGSVPLSGVTVVDDNFTPGNTDDDFSPAFAGGDTDQDGWLDVDETWIYEQTVAIDPSSTNSAAPAISFVIGGDVLTRITVTETGGGDLEVRVDVLSETGSIGDLRGVFFDVSDETLLAGLAATGGKVTATAFDADNVDEVGGGVNVRGDVVGTFGKFDGGVEIGSSGIGKDDVRSTSFILSHATQDLDIGLLAGQDFAVRLTSVGPEGGSREQSRKFGGTAPEAPSSQTFVNVATVDSDQTGPETDDEEVVVDPTLGSIAGRVFEDAEADGVENSAGIEGVTVELRDADGNVVATTTTDTTGGYLFANVAPGDYKVAFAAPGGFDGVSPLDAGGDDAVDSDGDTTTLTTATFTLAPSGVVENVDQGFWKSGGIGDFVFEDLDGDGIQDPGEDGVAGVEVTLRDGNSDAVATTTTAPDGTYLFDNLAPGTYSVAFDAPAGTLFTQPDAGANEASDSDAGQNGATAPVVVTSGTVNRDVDAGLVRPDVSLTKVADTATVSGANQTVTYTYTVKNEGSAPLTGVTLADAGFTADAGDDLFPQLVDDGNGDDVLDVGETWIYEANETISQAEIDAGGTLTNIATVDTDQTEEEQDDATITIVRTPDLEIVKEVTAVNGQSTDLTIRNADDVVTWTITVENTGNVTLTDVLVTDDALGFADTIATLAPGGTKSFTLEYIVTQEDIDGNGGGDGAIENVATATDDEAGEDTDGAIVPVARAPELAITKTATAVNGNADDIVVRNANDVVTYEIVVTNTGNETLTDVVVKDEKLEFEETIEELAPGEKQTFTVTYVATQDDIDTNGQHDGDIDNVATAEDDRAGKEEATEEVDVLRTPDLSFEKKVTAIDGDATKTTVDAAGQTISYELVVTNTGNTTLTDVTVIDPLTDASLELDELAPGDKATIKTSYKVTQEDIDDNGGGDGFVDNVATADSEETPEKPAEASVIIERNPEIAIVKTADKDVVTKAGQTVTYTYVLTNTGNVTLSDVAITDDNATPHDPTDDFTLTVGDLVSGDTDNDGKLDLDETWTFQETVAVTEAQVEDDEPLTNVAVVTTGEGATASDTATVDVETSDRCTDIEDHFDRPGSSAGAVKVGQGLPHQNGTNGDDFFWGDNTGNTISVNEGENLVVANGGDDIVNGGNSGDEMYGDGGNDVLNGNGGDDLLSGGNGHDKLYGAHGDDTILAGKGNDLVEGGEGKDRIHMGAGNDTVQGEGGDDCIAGGEDHGRIKGSVATGLTVKLGDELFGNGGADTFEYEAGDGVDFVFDYKAEDGDLMKFFGIDEDQATAVTANTPYGPAAGLAFDLDGDGKFDGGVFFQQLRTTAQVEDLVDNGAIEFI